MRRFIGGVLGSVVLATLLLSAANAQGPAPAYQDDRSTPKTVLSSYVNALNLQQYVRAYSYWEPQAAADNLPPYDEFEQGFADTMNVVLTTGDATSDSGAGQIYYSLPVALVVTSRSGGTQTFVGCYTLHLSRPEIQGVPPFAPLGIRSATVNEVPNGVDTGPLMAQACAQ